MTNNTKPESNQLRRAIPRPAIIAAIFLGLHVLPVFWRPNSLWGVDFLFYLPTSVRALFVLLAILLFIPGFRRQIRSRVGALPLALWGAGRRVWLTRGLLVLAALAAFISFSSARHFLGDGYHVLEKLDAYTWHDVYRAPFTNAIIGALHRLGSALWQTPENTYRVYSYVSGILYVILSFPVAAVVGKNTLEKSIVLAFLLTAGYLQQFFGYVENYALYMPGLLLYLFLGMRTQEFRIPLFVPALVMGVILALHPAFAVFGPSLLFLAYRTHRHGKSGGPPWKNLANTLVALCCVPVTTALLLVLSGVGFRAFLLSMSSGDVLPVFAEPGFHAQYRLFSLAHVLDFLNQQLLAAPAAFMVLFLYRKSDPGRHAFLVLCTIVPLIFTFTARANIGAFRDWDILSLPALPFTLLMAAVFLERVRNREQRFHSAWLVCGAAGLHTVLWIGLNASAAPAEARFTNQLGRLTGHASATGWVTLAKFHRGQQNLPAALVAYKRALDADPSNPNRWLTYGEALREMGRHASAIENFKKAVELQPDHAIPYMNLGAAYSDLGQFARAIEYTRKAIAIQPENAAAHLNLGAMYRLTGQPTNGIEHLEKAAALRPDHAATFSNLGAMYQEAGKFAKAIENFEKSIELRPRHIGTLVDLSIAYSDTGQYTRAIAALKRAVALQPDHFAAYLNLGAVHNRIGEYATGITYLKKSLEIQPNHPIAHVNLGLNYRAQGLYKRAIEHFEKALDVQEGQANAMAYMNIGHTYYKMREYDKAIPYFQKAVQLKPNDGNAHLLLGMAYRATKRGDEAGVHFEKTLRLQPDNPQAAQIRTWLDQASE